MNTHEFRSALWVAFWLFVLTAGDPDIIDVFIDFLKALTQMIGE